MAAKSTLSSRQGDLSSDLSERTERRAASGARGRKGAADSFTVEQVAECRELFDVFDKNSDGCIDRGEFGPMMRTLGLNLSERELDTFFDRMDVTQNGNIDFKELIEFLQKMARPTTLEEELLEAFCFFNPGEERDSKVITKEGLAKVLGDMGEDVTVVECGDMISAATGGLEVIDFQTFQRFCKPARGSSRTACFEEGYIE